MQQKQYLIEISLHECCLVNLMTISVTKVIQCHWEKNERGAWSAGEMMMMMMMGKLKFSKKNPPH
jgi:hypothetical protein